MWSSSLISSRMTSVVSIETEESPPSEIDSQPQSKPLLRSRGAEADTPHPYPPADQTEDDGVKVHCPSPTALQEQLQ